jgi:hypothetical protein
MVSFRADGIKAIDEVESSFSIHQCEKIQRRYVESIKVPKTVTRSVFPDGDMTEYRFTGRTSDVQDIHDQLNFDVVLPVLPPDHGLREYGQGGDFDHTVASTLHIYLKKWGSEKLIFLRGQYDLVFVRMDPQNPNIYHITGPYDRLRTYNSWVRRRFTSNDCW